MQQYRTVQSSAEVLSAEFPIVQIQQSLSAGIKDMKALDFGRMGQHLIEYSKLLEDHHSGRLEEESRAHCLTLFSPLEQNDIMPQPLQQYCGSRTCGSAADDSDAEARKIHFVR